MIISKWLGESPLAVRKYVLAVGVFLVACVTPLSAQQGQQLTRTKVEGKVIFGGVVFGEDVAHTTVGGAVRVYMTRRLSIEPEYLYMRGSDRDQDHLLQGNVAYDFFTDPSERFVAYTIGGVGVLHHQSRFVGNDFVTGAPRVFDNSVTTWSASAGLGAKIFVTKRLFVSPELRLGREPTLRATINVGYVFGGRR